MQYDKSLVSGKYNFHTICISKCPVLGRILYSDIFIFTDLYKNLLVIMQLVTFIMH